MTDAIWIDPDESNAAGIHVREVGGCYVISLLVFEGGPMSATISLPVKNAVDGLHRYLRTLQENEDIYAALLMDHIREHGRPK